MSNVNTIGMLMYLILAIVGGFLTGLFSRYAYQGARRDFSRIIAVLLSVVFYVAPSWAVVSLFKDDDLDVFYILLLLSFAVGVFVFGRISGPDSEDEPYYLPDDDD